MSPRLLVPAANPLIKEAKPFKETEGAAWSKRGNCHSGEEKWGKGNKAKTVNKYLNVNQDQVYNLKKED